MPKKPVSKTESAVSQPKQDNNGESRPKARVKTRRPKRRDAARSAGAAAGVNGTDWEPQLNAYKEKTLLRFESDKDLQAAIDLLWTDALRTLPHDTPDGRSIVIPAEAVDHFARSGIKFTAETLRSVSDLSAQEIQKLRS